MCCECELHNHIIRRRRRRCTYRDVIPIHAQNERLTGQHVECMYDRSTFDFDIIFSNADRRTFTMEISYFLRRRRRRRWNISFSLSHTNTHATVRSENCEFTIAIFVYDVMHPITFGSIVLRLFFRVKCVRSCCRRRRLVDRRSVDKTSNGNFKQTNWLRCETTQWTTRKQNPKP